MSARPGLCGGHRATGVPTAIANQRIVSGLPANRETSPFVDTSGFIGPNPTDEPITSGSCEERGQRDCKVSGHQPPSARILNRRGKYIDEPIRYCEGVGQRT